MHSRREKKNFRHWVGIGFATRRATMQSGKLWTIVFARSARSGSSSPSFASRNPRGLRSSISLALLMAGCEPAAEPEYATTNPGCLDTRGYQAGVEADEGHGELQGTHQLVEPVKLAANGQEGLLIYVGERFAEGTIEVTVDGALQLLALEEVCLDDGWDWPYFKVQVLGQNGIGHITLKPTGDARVVTEFTVPVATATSLEMAALAEAFIVGEEYRICAIVRDVEGEELYADDSIELTATDTQGNNLPLSIFDPGSACRGIYVNAPGLYTVDATGLGLTHTETFEAVAPPPSE